MESNIIQLEPTNEPNEDLVENIEQLEELSLPENLKTQSTCTNYNL